MNQNTRLIEECNFLRDENKKYAILVCSIKIQLILNLAEECREVLFGFTAKEEKTAEKKAGNFPFSSEAIDAGSSRKCGKNKIADPATIISESKNNL